MANKATPSSSVPRVEEDEEELVSGSESGWVEARTNCDRLATALSSDLTHVPSLDTHCTRCHHPNENWLCLCCKDVLCSRFINKHMLEHYQETTTHCVTLSYSDLSVWCYSCNAYLDARVILPLRPVYETAYLLKFGKAPPVRLVEYCDHLATALSSDLTHIPTLDTHCTRCHHPNENWLCLCCKDVLCSRYINKHMLEHYQETTTHCVVLSYSDLSVWCYSCNAYLDARVILPLRPVYETAYLLKFGKAPPVRLVEYCDHLATALSSDLTHIPTLDTHCTRMQSLRDVLYSPSPLQPYASSGASSEAFYTPQVNDDLIPKIEQVFASLEDAHNFYNDYAREAGFGVQIHSNKLGKGGLTVRKEFVCHKEGVRAKKYTQNVSENTIRKRGLTRENCGAKMTVVKRGEGFDVTQFVASHNHLPSTPKKVHLLRSYRKLSAAQRALTDQLGDADVLTHQQMSILEMQVGGLQNVGCSQQNLYNAQRDKRKIVDGHDASLLVEYFEAQQEKNPSFTFAILPDDEGSLYHCFWADATMRKSYQYLGTW